MARAGKKIMLPLANRPIPLIADEWAKPELGSGCVKITPLMIRMTTRLLLRFIADDQHPSTDGTLNENGGATAGLTCPKPGRRSWRILRLLSCSIESSNGKSIWLTAIEARLRSNRSWLINGSSRWSNWRNQPWTRDDGHVEILPNRYAKGYLDCWVKSETGQSVDSSVVGHQIPFGLPIVKRKLLARPHVRKSKASKNARRLVACGQESLTVLHVVSARILQLQLSWKALDWFVRKTFSILV